MSGPPVHDQSIGGSDGNNFNTKEVYEMRINKTD